MSAPETASLPARWPWSWVLGASLLGWTLVALAFLPQFAALSVPKGAPPDMQRALTSAVTAFLPWALLTPLTLAFARRHSPRIGWWRSAGWHLVGVIVVVGAEMLAAQGMMHLFGHGQPWKVAWPRLLLGFGATSLIIYLALAALGTALDAAERARDSERRRAHAELAALKSQLQPHFLFNALNAIAELGYSDPKRAEAVTLRLAAMLRRVLAGQQQEGITLADELVLAEDGLAIHQALLGERLHYRIDVPDDLRARQVPPLLLQPLVENAVRHGVAPHPAGGEVAIHARRDGAQLVVEVINSGAALPTAPRAGLGLDNVRRRLAVLHGDAASLELATRDGRTHACLRLPLPA